MANSGWARLGRWLPLLLFLVTTGCSITIDPWLHGKTPADPNKHLEGPSLKPPDPGLLGPGTAAKGLPGPPQPQALPPSSDQISLLMQRLATVEDDRKVQAARLQQLETQLREKEQAVTRATYEIQESTTQTKKTRDDLQRWKSEMEDLRMRVRTMENENKITLDAILKTLEQFIDKDSVKHRP